MLAIGCLLCGCQAVGLKADDDVRQSADVGTEVEQAVASGGRASAITLNWVTQGAGSAATVLAIVATWLMIRNRRAVDRLVLSIEQDNAKGVKRVVQRKGTRASGFGNRVDAVERIIRASLRRVAELK